MDKNSELFKAIDYILNKSSPDELSVIQQALNRRVDDLKNSHLQLNIRQMAKDITKSVENQLMNFTSIHDLVRNFVRDIIIKNQPHISDEDLKVLLEQWVPEADARKSLLPADVLKTLVKQFLDFSLSRMDVATKAQMEKGWTEKYWRNFPPAVQSLISEFLNGKSSEKEFWSKLDYFLD